MRPPYLIYFLVWISGLFALQVFATDPTDTNRLIGHWEGRIAIQDNELDLLVDINADPDLTAAFSIPAQRVKRMPLVNITVVGDSVRFEFPPQLGVARFFGHLTDGHIEGRFQQNGQDMSFHLDRLDLLEPVYPSRPISLRTDSGTLYGTLDLPSGQGPFTVVLIHAGSGPTDRDGNTPIMSGDNNGLLKLGQALSHAGLATVRFDKRGIGQSLQSVKSELDLRFDDYINDMAAWIRQLKADPRFDRLVVLGHSEGALIGLMAAKHEGVDAYVSIAGVGRPAFDIILEQVAVQPNIDLTACRHIIAELRLDRTVADVPPSLQSIFRPSVQPYMASWFRYDPAQELADFDKPVLLVQGERDIQVQMADVRLLAEANPNAELKIFPQMNHVLKDVSDDQADNVAAYTDPARPLAAGLAASLIDFLNRTLDLDLETKPRRTP